VRLRSDADPVSPRHYELKPRDRHRDQSVGPGAAARPAIAVVPL